MSPPLSSRAVVAVSLSGLLLATTGLVACSGGSNNTASPGAAVTSATTSAAASATTAPAASATAASSAGFHAVDACSLLTASDVASLVPQPSFKSSQDPSDPLSSSHCHWEPGAPTGLVPPTLDVTVSKLPPLPSGATIKQIFSVEAADHKGRLLDGIGDAALVESVISASAEVKAVKGPYYVDIELSMADASKQQDAVSALARTALGRLS